MVEPKASKKEIILNFRVIKYVRNSGVIVRFFKCDIFSLKENDSELKKSQTELFFTLTDHLVFGRF